MSKSIGLEMIDYATSLEILKPDFVIAIGDRFDVLPWVISGNDEYSIAHTMGGEIGTIDESIRHAITKFANVHFPANNDSAKRIEKWENIQILYFCWMPRIDFIISCLKKIKKRTFISSNNIFKSYKGVGETF